MNFSSKKNIIIIVIAAVLALGVGGTAIGINVYNSPSSRVSRYLGAAERYLSEMNYEQAVIEFKNILKIEPMNVDAYMGLADAYIGMGDKEKALEVLREGLEITGDTRIQERIDELTKPAESSSAPENSTVPQSSTAPVESKPENGEPVYGDAECLQIEEMIEAYLHGEGTIDTSKLKNVTSLNIYGVDVAEVRCGNRYGTQHFNSRYSKDKVTLTTKDGVETEVLRGNIDNLMEDIHFIFDIPQLNVLGIECNQIKDITPLAGLTKLESLNLRVNQISDITPLAGLTNLTSLRLYNNQISDILPLAELTKLTSLGLSMNQISDILPLAELTKLTSLSLTNNQISDITPLVGLTNLKYLYLSSNQISDIKPLAGLTKLTKLEVKRNKISDITPLAGLKNLTELKLYNNQISDEDIAWIKEQLPNCKINP